MKYQITVKPGSKVEKIVEATSGFTIYTHAHAHDNEANQSIIKILAKHFHVAKSQIKIISGAKSKQKVIEIE